MTTRAARKEETRRKILDAASRRLRTEGPSGTGVAAVMDDAGLTHGAFYAHFASKDALLAEALAYALAENRRRWLGRLRDESWPARLARLAASYLTRAHRDDPADSCALAALAGAAGRASDAWRRVYEGELLASLKGVSGGIDAVVVPEGARQDEALAFLALCVGGLSLSRAVADPGLSDRILDACARSAGRLASFPKPQEDGKTPDHAAR